jgi:hypothetical protein
MMIKLPVRVNIMIKLPVRVNMIKLPDPQNALHLRNFANTGFTTTTPY